MHKKGFTTLVSLILAFVTVLSAGAFLSSRVRAANPTLNLGIVQQMFTAFESVDLSTLSSQFTDDVVWIQPGGPSLPLSGTYRGPQAVVDLFQRIDAMVEVLDFQPRAFLTQGNQVVLRGWVQARVRPDGQPFALDFVQFWTLRDDGKISRVETFADTAELASTAGVSKMTPGLASPATSADQSSALNEQTARHLFDIINTGNLDAIDQYVVPSFISHDPQSPPLDPTLWKQEIGAYRQAFPDLHFTIDDAVSQQNQVFLRWTATGTNTGKFMGAAPTKKTVKLTGLTVLLFRDGKAIEETASWDTLGMMQQLGLAPAPKTAGR